MKWVIDTSKDDNSNEKMIAALKANDCEYQLFQYKPFMNYKDVLEEIRFDLNEKIMCYGTINFISKIRKCTDIKPGSYCDFDKYRCSAYHPHLGGLLLNSRYKIIPWRKIASCMDMGTFFIRPDSGKKLFTGVVTDYDSLRTDIGFAAAGLEPETKVLVAPYQRVEEEWRFFVSNGHVITGSLYNVKGEHFESELVDMHAFELAYEASKCYNPDPVYVIDICKTQSGEYKVLELNSFSCSGLYSCDVNEIVKFIEENG